MVLSMCLTSFFCFWLFSFPSTICRKKLSIITWPYKWGLVFGLYILLGIFVSSTLFWLPFFVISFEIRKSESSCSFFQDCFGYLESLEIPMNCKMSFLISAKNVLIGITGTLWITLGGIDFWNNIKFSYLWI